MTRSVAREFWNGSWSILALIMVTMLLVFVLNSWWNNRTKDNWYSLPGVQVGIGLLVYFTASFMRTGWIYLRLSCENDKAEGLSVPPATSLHMVDCSWVYGMISYSLEVSAVFGIIGAICVVRVISPDSWRPYSWIAAMVLAVALPLLLLL